MLALIEGWMQLLGYQGVCQAYTHSRQGRYYWTNENYMQTILETCEYHRHFMQSAVRIWYRGLRTTCEKSVISLRERLIFTKAVAMLKPHSNAASLYTDIAYCGFLFQTKTIDWLGNITVRTAGTHTYAKGVCWGGTRQCCCARKYSNRCLRCQRRSEIYLMVACRRRSIKEVIPCIILDLWKDCRMLVLCTCRSKKHLTFYRRRNTRRREWKVGIWGSHLPEHIE